MRVVDPLFKNLKALEDASFPKHCSACNKVFSDEVEFIAHTQPFKTDSGLSEAENEKGETFVKLARRCLCGQPILDHFGNRRDNTAKGKIRRQAFEKVIKTLVARGVEPKTARVELLNYMNNKGSALLESHGIFSQR